MTTPCPYCGAENPDTCLECRTCQRHLPARTLQIAPRRFSPVTGLRLVLFLAALAALVLILLTPEVPGEVDEAAEVDLFYRQLVAMEHAVRKKNEYSWTVREGDANAYLSAVVQEHELHRKGSWRRLVLARVDFQDGAALLTLHHQWGPVVLSQQINLSPPKTGEPSSPWQIQSFVLGKLPIPGLLRSRAAHLVLNAFGGFERDLFVLQHVFEIHIDDEKAYLVNRRKTV